MAYSLRIYKRKARGESLGMLEQRFPLEAKTDADADAEAVMHLHQHPIDFDTHYAAVMSDDASFVNFWLSRL